MSYTVGRRVRHVRPPHDRASVGTRPCNHGPMVRSRFALAMVIVLALTGCGPALGERASVGPSEPAAPASLPAGASAPAAASRDLGDVNLALEPVVELEAPTAMADRAGDEDALYVAERAGRIVRVVDGTVDSAPVLDISDRTTSDGERGLLGIDFSGDGSRLYVSYTDRNGGNVVTGPDGLLYYGLGDGGSAGDPHNHGQDLSTLLGAMLRIDPRPGDGGPYRLPEDNPFVDDDHARPEIWIYGLRNPWRFSFDRLTDDLWIGDVGQGAIEEIDWLPFDQAGGTNLGWRVFEGTRRYAEGTAENAVPPVYEYPHDGGRCSVTGGYVYRGAQIDGLDGAYLYSDFCDGVIRAIVLDGNEVTARHQFDAEVPALVAFGEDSRG